MRWWNAIGGLCECVHNRNWLIRNVRRMCSVLIYSEIKNPEVYSNHQSPIILNKYFMLCTYSFTFSQTFLKNIFNNYILSIILQATKKRRIVARVQCRNIKDECPKVTCDEPVQLPGRCCKLCPGDLYSKYTFNYFRNNIFIWFLIIIRYIFYNEYSNNTINWEYKYFFLPETLKYWLVPI